MIIWNSADERLTKMGVQELAELYTKQVTYLSEEIRSGTTWDSLAEARRTLTRIGKVISKKCKKDRQ